MLQTEAARQQDFHHHLCSSLSSAGIEGIFWKTEGLDSDNFTDAAHRDCDFSLQKESRTGGFTESCPTIAPVAKLSAAFTTAQAVGITDSTAAITAPPSSPARFDAVREASVCVDEFEEKVFAELAKPRAAYCQVIKEAVLCFTVLSAQRRILCHPLPYSTLGSATNERTSVPLAPPFKATRQRAMIETTRRILRHAAQQEAETQRTLLTLRVCGLQSVPISKLEKASVLLHVPEVPMQCWSGWGHYAGGFCLPVSPLKRGLTKKKALVRKGRWSRCIITPAEVAREVRAYWKLHSEAESHARLQALQGKDTEDFAEHVSQLKISALLNIMKRTHEFMQQIGLQLGNKLERTAPEGFVSPHEQEQRTIAALAAVPDRVRASDEYQRFKAYVASTKDEFKLVHQRSVFVSSQPSGLHATLMPHQMDGLRFLASLHANHINGILADEMGVGKTIQTLAFLLYLKEQAPHSQGTWNPCCNTATSRPIASAPLHHRPHLVLAPLTVIREWRDACEQFALGSLRVAAYQELRCPTREVQDYDLVLVPLHAVRRIHLELRRIQWSYLIVDEAHKAVSHLHTLTARSILGVPCERRLVLTGTPLNSDLSELWSLLYFLNPSVFTEGDSFDNVFRRPFEGHQTKEMELSSEESDLIVLRLHQILRPFMLRRTKKDIDATLRITFYTIHCPLTAMQARLLHMLRTTKRTPCVRVLDAFDEGPNPASCPKKDEEGILKEGCPRDDAEKTEQEAKGAGGAARRRPRQPPICQREVSTRAYGLTCVGASETTAQLLCNHAFLIPFCDRVLALHQRKGGPTSNSNTNVCEAGLLACSGKFMLLHLLLSRLFFARRKAVIFTHWLDCVDLLTEYMSSCGWGSFVEFLSGNTTEEDRKVRVRRFRESADCLFFVVSMKAGGCGINLQVAHMVILLDRDYTMTNEDQALARVYRIGQLFTVRALYFTTADPAETRIAARAARKNRPRQLLIENGNYHAGAADASAAAYPEEEEKEGAYPSSSSSFMDAARHETSTGAMDAFVRLWALPPVWAKRCAKAAAVGSTSFSLHPALRLKDGTRFALTDAHWAVLREGIEGFDRLVLTETDLADKGLLVRMQQSLPPGSCDEFERAWAAMMQTNGKSNPARARGRGRAPHAGLGEKYHLHEWVSFWCVFHEALRGPPLLQHAVDTAIEEDARLHCQVLQRTLKRRRMGE